MSNAPRWLARAAPWLWRAGLAAVLAAGLMLYTRPGFVFDLANRWLLCGG